MTSTEADLMIDNSVLIEGHIHTLLESDDVEAVRTSAVTLMNTEAGRAYLATNPIAI